MKPYLTVFQARFRTLLQYRAAALAGFATQLFWGLIRVMIFEAFYRSTTAPQPMTYDETVTYLWLTQALLLLLPWLVDWEVRALVREGTVAYEFVRPIDLYWFWFSRYVAARTAPVMLRAVPMFILAGLAFGMGLPASPSSALAFIAAVVVSVLLGAAISALMAISLLWTISGDGISRLVATLAMALSGSIIPLPFYPDWAQPILNLLPFRGLMDVPFRLYLGHIPPLEAIPLLIQQLAWTVALILLGRWLLGQGTRRLVVQGG